jgi:hypothetical protein
MSSPILFGPSYSNNLQSGLGFSNGSGPSIQTGTVNPSVTATNGVTGSLYLNSSTAVTYQKQDNGTTTNWTILGPIGSPVNARVYLNTTTAFTASNPIVFNAVLFDTNSAYSTSTGIYTAPVAGKYLIALTFQPTTSGAVDAYVLVNSTTYGYIATTAGLGVTSGSLILSLSVGDQVSIILQESATLTGADVGGPTTSLSIALLTVNVNVVSPSVKAPTVQTFTSGSGTYTLPTSPTPLYIEVEMIGGGGGGGAVGGSSGNGTAGGNSTFGTSLLIATGGAGGTSASSSSNGGAGGTASVATSSTVYQVIAQSGNYGSGYVGVVNAAGGAGAASPFGGGGSTGTGYSANSTNSYGAGGASGGGTVSSGTAGGGGSGGYLKAIISNPSASYFYAVGGIGAGGAGGTDNGGNGGSGVIIVKEYYQ